MKQYVIDEFRPDDYQKIKTYLDTHHAAPGFDGLYWLQLDEAAYEEVQTRHDACRPFYFALELTPERLACELLVRTNKRIRCDCICYATQQQRNWLIDQVDGICDRIGIIV